MTEVDKTKGFSGKAKFPTYEIKVKLYGQEEPETHTVTECEDIHELTLHIQRVMTVGFQRKPDDEGWTEIVPAGRIQRIKYREVK